MSNLIAFPVFNELLHHEKLLLPIERSNCSETSEPDYYSDLRSLFVFYINRLADYSPEFTNSNTPRILIQLVYNISSLLLKSVENYSNGMPVKAYHCFEDVMRILIKNPFMSSTIINYEIANVSTSLFLPILFRVVSNNSSAGECRRERVFHAPYTIRKKVSTTRYSIPGFPSLYLGTSLNLCCQEIGCDPFKASSNKLFAARFQAVTGKVSFRVVDLGYRPQDFRISKPKDKQDQYIQLIIHKAEARLNYLLWYPLIASCSFIRVGEVSPFVPEYIIPQLLMQWIRFASSQNGIWENEIIGIRYFSCASKERAGMGYNYVFPTSGKAISDKQQYCSLLADAFSLTTPVCINEFESFSSCEDYINKIRDFEHI